MALTLKTENPKPYTGCRDPSLASKDRSKVILSWAKPAIAGFGIEGTNWESETP